MCFGKLLVLWRSDWHPSILRYHFLPPTDRAFVFFSVLCSDRHFSPFCSFYLMGWSPTFWTIGNTILTGHLDEEAGGKEQQIVGMWIHAFAVMQEHALNIVGEGRSQLV